MADPTLDATAKGANSNSYVTRAEAQTYFDGRLNADEWENATAGNKDKSLIQATAYLERFEYQGTVTDLQTPQRLKWPRLGLFDADGRDLDEDTVPNAVKEATYEVALALLDGKLDMQNDGTEQYESVTVGPISVTNRVRDATKMPEHVRQLIDFLLAGSSSALNRRLVRS
jgi:hypothetical protein